MSEYAAHTLPTTLTICARSNKHGERPVLVNTDLCGACHATFKRALKQLVDVWPDLLDAVMKRPARVYSDMPSGNAGGGSTKDASSYWNPAATMVIADVTEWYVFLADTIVTERPTPADQVAPAAPFIGPLTRDATNKARDMIARTVTTWSLDGTEDVRHGLAAIAIQHHRWLSHHPSLGASLLEDALRFLWAIEQALQTVPMQRITLAGMYCQVVMEETEYGPRLCEGQLVGVIRASIDGPSEVLCSNHPGHAIPADAWPLPDSGDPDAGDLNYWVAIDFAAARLGTTIRRTYKLATADGWRHTPNKRDRGYSMADVENTRLRLKDTTNA